MKLVRSRSIRFIIGAFLTLIIIISIRVFFPTTVFAPSLESLVLGAQTGEDVADNSSTFTLENLPAIDDSIVNAKSYLVYDQSSGAPLALRSPNANLSIASLTKLMTGYLVNKYGSLDDTFTIPAKAVFNISPVLGLPAGESVKVRDLFNSMIVGSANDAALNLAAYVEQKMGQPIEKLMNTEAANLQMSNTHFSNPLGFDSETNYSTANDLKILVQAINNYPVFNNLDRLQSYSFISTTGKSYSVKATNKLLAGDSEIHAIKTGFTDEAQGTMITSIHHSSGSFVIIVLGSENREQDTKILKEQTIKTFYSQTPPRN